MSQLVVIGFANEYMAEEVRQALFRMQAALDAVRAYS